MRDYLENKNSLNIFDICGTLYKVNTTFEYIKFFHKKNKNFFKYIYVRVVTSKLGKLLAFIFNFSIRKSVIKTLSGFDIKVLNLTAEKFYDEVLESEKNQLIFRFFENTDNKMLLSASIDPVVNVIAKRLNCIAKSTLLKYNQNDICLGKILEDVKGNKLSKIEGEKIIKVFTDNFEDIDIINKSEKAYLIYPNQKRKNRWDGVVNKSIKINDFQFLKV